MPPDFKTLLDGATRNINENPSEFCEAIDAFCARGWNRPRGDLRDWMPLLESSANLATKAVERAEPELEDSGYGLSILSSNDEQILCSVLDFWSFMVDHNSNRGSMPAVVETIARKLLFSASISVLLSATRFVSKYFSWFHTLTHLELRELFAGLARHVDVRAAVAGTIPGPKVAGWTLNLPGVPFEYTIPADARYPESAIALFHEARRRKLSLADVSTLRVRLLSGLATLTPGGLSKLIAVNGYALAVLSQLMQPQEFEAHILEANPHVLSDVSGVLSLPPQSLIDSYWCKAEILSALQDFLGGQRVPSATRFIRQLGLFDYIPHVMTMTLETGDNNAATRLLYCVMSASTSTIVSVGLVPLLVNLVVDTPDTPLLLRPRNVVLEILQLIVNQGRDNLATAVFEPIAALPRLLNALSQQVDLVREPSYSEYPPDFCDVDYSLSYHRTQYIKALLIFFTNMLSRRPTRSLVDMLVDSPMLSTCTYLVADVPERVGSRAVLFAAQVLSDLTQNDRRVLHALRDRNLLQHLIDKSLPRLYELGARYIESAALIARAVAGDLSSNGRSLHLLSILAAVERVDMGIENMEVPLDAPSLDWIVENGTDIELEARTISKHLQRMIARSNSLLDAALKCDDRRRATNIIMWLVQYFDGLMYPEPESQLSMSIARQFCRLEGNVTELVKLLCRPNVDNRAAIEDPTAGQVVLLQHILHCAGAHEVAKPMFVALQELGQPLLSMSWLDAQHDMEYSNSYRHFGETCRLIALTIDYHWVLSEEGVSSVIQAFCDTYPLLRVPLARFDMWSTAIDGLSGFDSESIAIFWMGWIDLATEFAPLPTRGPTLDLSSATTVYEKLFTLVGQSITSLLTEMDCADAISVLGGAEPDWSYLILGRIGDSDHITLFITGYLMLAGILNGQHGVIQLWHTACKWAAQHTASEVDNFSQSVQLGCERIIRTILTPLPREAVDPMLQVNELLTLFDEPDLDPKAASELFRFLLDFMGHFMDSDGARNENVHIVVKQIEDKIMNVPSMQVLAAILSQIRTDDPIDASQLAPLLLRQYQGDVGTEALILMASILEKFPALLPSQVFRYCDLLTARWDAGDHEWILCAVRALRAALKCVATSSSENRYDIDFPIPSALAGNLISRMADSMSGSVSIGVVVAMAKMASTLVSYSVAAAGKVLSSGFIGAVLKWVSGDIRKMAASADSVITSSHICPLEKPLMALVRGVVESDTGYATILAQAITSWFDDRRRFPQDRHIRDEIPLSFVKRKLGVCLAIVKAGAVRQCMDEQIQNADDYSYWWSPPRDESIGQLIHSIGIQSVDISQLRALISQLADSLVMPILEFESVNAWSDRGCDDMDVVQNMILGILGTIAPTYGIVRNILREKPHVIRFLLLWRRVDLPRHALSWPILSSLILPTRDEIQIPPAETVSEGVLTMLHSCAEVIAATLRQILEDIAPESAAEVKVGAQTLQAVAVLETIADVLINLIQLRADIRIIKFDPEPFVLTALAEQGVFTLFLQRYNEIDVRGLNAHWRLTILKLFNVLAEFGTESFETLDAASRLSPAPAEVVDSESSELDRAVTDYEDQEMENSLPPSEIVTERHDLSEDDMSTDSETFHLTLHQRRSLHRSHRMSGLGSRGSRGSAGRFRHSTLGALENADDTEEEEAESAMELDDMADHATDDEPVSDGDGEEMSVVDEISSVDNEDVSEGDEDGSHRAHMIIDDGYDSYDYDSYDAESDSSGFSDDSASEDDMLSESDVVGEPSDGLDQESVHSDASGGASEGSNSEHIAEFEIDLDEINPHIIGISDDDSGEELRGHVTSPIFDRLHQHVASNLSAVFEMSFTDSLYRDDTSRDQKDAKYQIPSPDESLVQESSIDDWHYILGRARDPEAGENVPPLSADSPQGNRNFRSSSQITQGDSQNRDQKTKIKPLSQICLLSLASVASLSRMLFSQIREDEMRALTQVFGRIPDEEKLKILLPILEAGAQGTTSAALSHLLPEDSRKFTLSMDDGQSAPFAITNVLTILHRLGSKTDLWKKISCSPQWLQGALSIIRKPLIYNSKRLLPRAAVFFAEIASANKDEERHQELVQQVVPILGAPACTEEVFMTVMKVLTLEPNHIPLDALFAEAQRAVETVAADLRKAPLSSSQTSEGHVRGLQSHQAWLLRVLTALRELPVPGESSGLLLATDQDKSGANTRQRKGTDNSGANEKQWRERKCDFLAHLDLFALWKEVHNRLGSGYVEGPNRVFFHTLLLPLVETLALAVQMTEGVTNEYAQSVQKFLVDFSYEHRQAINQLLRNNLNLLTGPLGVLARDHHVLDFDIKQLHFNRLLDRDARYWHDTEVTLTVDRAEILEDSFRGFMELAGHEELKSRLLITFRGEEGIDAGGVSREWLELLSRELLSPNYGLFLPTTRGAAVFQVNPNSDVNADHVQYFLFTGMVLGKALYDKRSVSCYFSRAVYKFLLDKPVDLTDMEAVDESYYRNLVWMLENDITDVLTETFSVTEDRFGQQRVVELKPGGENIEVTEENKQDYVGLLVDYKLIKSVRYQLEALRRGFYSVIQPEWVQYFDEQDLELLSCGLPDIDIEDWRRNTMYTNYTAHSPQIEWFWRAVESFSGDERAKLLQFATGTSKVPVQGFAHLQATNGGPDRFNIHKEYGSISRLPSSHTCSNQLNLPVYESYEQLRAALFKAITEGHSGFGFV